MLIIIQIIYKNKKNKIMYIIQCTCITKDVDILGWGC